MLGGVLLPNIGDALPNLRLLTLEDNKFDGHIPASIGISSKIEYIDLALNNISGPIPRSFGKLSKLSYLFLEGNMIEASNDESWEFLHAMGNCSLLQLISLEDNQLQGGIPSSVGNMSVNLRFFALAQNHLSGTIPTSIGNLHGLTYLWLAFNNLTGTVEGRFEKMAHLQYLGIEAVRV